MDASPYSVRFLVSMWSLMLCGITPAIPSGAVEFDIVQLTDNDYTDSGPQIDGLHVVWRGRPTGEPEQVFEWKGGAPQVVPEIQPPDDVRLSQGKIYWMDGQTLYAWDGSSTQVVLTQFISSDFAVDAGQVAYRTYHFSPRRGNPIYSSEIFVFDGVAHTQITADAFDDEVVRFRAGGIAWLRTRNVNDSRIRSLPLGYGTNRNPATYQAGADVFVHYDGRTRRVTPSKTHDLHHSVYGDRVAFASWDYNDLEVFLYEGGEITQVTDNTVEDRGPRVSSEGVAWTGWDGSDYEIFFYDGSDVSQVTNDTIHQFVGNVSGSMIVWAASDGNDLEIYLATPAAQKARALPLILVPWVVALGASIASRYRSSATGAGAGRNLS